MSKLQESYILHIPHSSTYIPSKKYFVTPFLEHEIDLLTDWQVDAIFNLPEFITIVANFSRVFCDVERLSDDIEPMYKKGMGIYYTYTDDLQILRKLVPEFKKEIIDRYYKPHHQKLEQVVKEKLDKLGSALIIDCHSFSSVPLKRESNQSLHRPDICLGTDKFHTPFTILNKLKNFFTSQGLQVEINKPYSGTIVPLKYYQNDKRVESIMIEINKKLYMDEKSIKIFPEKIEWLNLMMKQFFSY